VPRALLRGLARQKLQFGCSTIDSSSLTAACARRALYLAAGSRTPLRSQRWLEASGSRSRLQSSQPQTARLLASSTPPRPATAASRGLSGAFAPAPDSLDGDALQSAIVAPLTFPAQAHRDGSRLQRARAVGCGVGASEAGVGRPDERRKLAAVPRPLLGALSSCLQARPGAGTSRGCSIEPPGAAVWRPDSLCTHRAAAFRVFSAASSSARLGAPEASVWLPDFWLKLAHGRLCSASSLPSCRVNPVRACGKFYRSASMIQFV